ncbi:MAG: hypothetical protein SF162_15325 [bacterium]|nr:hypothetical protein [bacterium]
MLLSLHLLLTLLTPPAPSPLVRRLLLRDAADKADLAAGRHTTVRRSPLRRIAPLVRAALVIIVPIAAILFLFPSMIVVYLSALAYAPVMMPVIALAFGLIFTGSVAASIAREHENRTYDLLSVIPYGRFGLHWLYCRNWIRLNQRQFWFVLPFMGIGAASLLFGLGVIDLLSAPPFVSLVQRLLLVAAYLFDALQSFAAAAVIGMWIPAAATNRINARLNAMGLFALVQMATYGLLAALGGVVLPLINPPNISQVVQIGMTALWLLVFLAGREFLIVALWRAMLAQLNVTTTELDLTSRAEV